jgi:homoserine dehydrogenase
VIADVVDVVRMLTADRDNRVPHLAFQPGSLSEMPILPVEEVVSGYYLRLTVNERPGVLAKIASILSESEISINAIVQKETHQRQVPVIILTQDVKEKLMNEAIVKIEALADVNEAVTRIRVEHL